MSEQEICVIAFFFSFCEAKETLLINFATITKGQLISKCLIGSIVSTKKPTKFF